MRTALDVAKLHTFMEELGRRAQSSGRVYLVGGSTALLLGIREQTIDIDLKLDPEPIGVFEGIAGIKERLAINVELASPDLFLPPLPGWRDRSEFIVRHRLVEFYHYDFYSQVLAKLLRGHRHDLGDARALVALDKVDASRLVDLFESIRAGLVRYPAINPASFDERVRAFVEESDARS